MGGGLPRPPDSRPRRGVTGVCTWGMASWDPFGGGVKGQTLDSSSWQFPSPRCSHTPSALPRPLGGPRRKSKPRANKEPLPRVCCGWALAQRASTADVHGISRPLGAPAPRPNIDRCLPRACPQLLPLPRCGRRALCPDGWSQPRGFSTLNCRDAV